MKVQKILMSAAFLVAIIGAFAFKSSHLLPKGKFAVQPVYYQATNPCDTQVNCKDSGTITCVSGIGLTAYSDDANCAGGSAFRFKNP